MRPARALLSVAILLATAAPAIAADGDPGRGKRRSVKVMVVTMFDVPGGTMPGEARNWIDREGLTEAISVPGLSRNFPVILCRPPAGRVHGADRDARDLCLITTDVGYANAGTSIMALLLSDQFDLTHTYFVIAGIAGVDPADGTL